MEKQPHIEKVIIKNYSSNTEGVILETNIPAHLKSDKHKRKSQKTFLSWDKIGSLIFENYVELTSVEELDKLRGAITN